MERARGVEQTAVRDLEFHRAIAKATHNPLYLVLHDVIGDALIEVRRGNHARGGREDAIESHRKIVEYIAAHEQAKSMMRHHLQVVEQIWESTMAGSSGSD